MKKTEREIGRMEGKIDAYYEILEAPILKSSWGRRGIVDSKKFHKFTNNIWLKLGELEHELEKLKEIQR